jgi:hypothetical protein
MLIKQNKSTKNYVKITLKTKLSDLKFINIKWKTLNINKYI